MVDKDHWTSASYTITWHSLDSLVWMFVTRADLPHVTFAELYLYFCKSQLLTHKRVHSTGGKKSNEERKKGYGKSAKGGNPSSASGEPKGKGA